MVNVVFGCALRVNQLIMSHFLEGGCVAPKTGSVCPAQFVKKLLYERFWKTEIFKNCTNIITWKMVHI